MPDSFTGGAAAPTAANKTFMLDDTSQEVSDPSTPAVISVGLECIDLTATRVNAGLFMQGTASLNTRICTGRPISVALTNVGAGYTKLTGIGGVGLRVSKNIFNETFGIHGLSASSSNSLTANKGYRPNQTFYVYGISRSVINGALPSVVGLTAQSFMVNFKAKCQTDNRGVLKTVTIIDKGTHFQKSEGNNALRFLHVNADTLRVYSNDPTDDNFIAEENTLNNISLTFNGNQLGNTALNNSNFFAPENHFPKAPLVIETRSDHLSGGSINKFYIKENGSGFNSSQTILNPYGNISFTPPTI